MILDSSAVAAIALGEPDADRFLDQIAAAERVAISAATFVEVGIVLSHRKGRPMAATLELLFQKLGVEIIPFTDEHRQAALDAWWRFGRTRSPAALNFGDCIAYGTASIESEPLLFKGDDFTRTDIPPA